MNNFLRLWGHPWFYQKLFCSTTLIFVLQLQEKDNLTVTPYEKNLDFWRQLWRVIERSSVVVQIVDARNPLLFRFVPLLYFYYPQLSRFFWARPCKYHYHILFGASWMNEWINKKDLRAKQSETKGKSCWKISSTGFQHQEEQLCSVWV